MTEKNYDWSYFRRRIYFDNSSKSELFRKWATPSGITEWFIEFATYTGADGNARGPNEVVRAGDKYTWIFHKGSVVEGEVLGVVEDSLFKFTFGKKEPGSDEDVVVRISLDEKDGMTEIELEQSNIADNEYGKVTYNLSCMVGWSYYLTNMRSIFESGYDFREKDEQLAKESTAYSLEK